MLPSIPWRDLISRPINSNLHTGENRHFSKKMGKNRQNCGHHMDPMCVILNDFFSAYVGPAHHFANRHHQTSGAFRPHHPRPLRLRHAHVLCQNQVRLGPRAV
jgi:hypothetical protein